MKSLIVNKTRDSEIRMSDITCWLTQSFNTLTYGAWEIQIVKPKRSHDQNALFRMWVACISKETGNTIQEVYQYYCEKFNSKYADKFTYDKHGTMVSGATSSMNVTEFKTFLNDVQADAASELGIILPSPEDRAWSVFTDQYGNYN